MCIQVFHSTDFDFLLEMAHTLWPDYTEEELAKDLRQSIRSPKEQVFLAKREDIPIGFIQVSLRSDYVHGAETSPVGYVEGLFVKKRFRKLGIARKLVKRGEKWALEQGCTEMGSDTWAWNTDSQKFHRAIGFREEDTIVHFIKEIETNSPSDSP